MRRSPRMGWLLGAMGLLGVAGCSGSIGSLGGRDATDAAADATPTPGPDAGEADALGGGDAIGAADAPPTPGPDAGVVDALAGGDGTATDAVVVTVGDGGYVIGPTITDFTASGPITVTSGQTIEGLAITSTSGPCITGDGLTDVRITNNRIGPCAAGVNGIGIALSSSSNVRTDHNEIDDVASGLYLVSNSDHIVFDHNHVTRVRGPFPRGQMVQFNTVYGEGNQIICNVNDESTPGYLDGPEDHVSTFASRGTAASSFLVAYNKIRGGGPSTSGGGILAGDYDGEYIEIRGNILINPGQYGLGIAGGRYHKMIDNVVYAPDVFTWSNIGLFAWAQAGSVSCYGHEVRGNRVLFMDKNGTENDSWDAGNCGTIAGWADNVFGDHTLGPEIWDTDIPECH